MAHPLRILLVLVAAAAFGQESAPLPWYMRETAMSADGRLTFLDKPWWPRAKALPEGGSFTLDLNGDGRPDTLVERENGNIVEVIDDTGRAANILNRVSSAYVVSLKGTGIVDRMIAYIDNDGDGKADEMEIRYYRDGYLRYGWFGENHDRDGAQIFSLKNWSYDGNVNWTSKFRGNVEIYLNKYNPRARAWTPLSECPFSFWDPDRDGRADVVLRVSAAPLSSNTGADIDYANNYRYMWGPEAMPLDRMGAMNFRLSYNIDPEPRRDPLEKPHFNFGFTMLGEQPYTYPEMRYTNRRRRPPQTVVRMGWEDGVKEALRYPAQRTGFSWDENREVWRWEGVFWMWEREVIPNTGGPVVRWNVRREYSPDPSASRTLYYSGVDKRYHLYGAKNGWLEVGHVVNGRKDLEFRYFDSDGDGYLDTTEVFVGSNPVPLRTSRIKDLRIRPVTLTREFLQTDYNQRVLPEAINDDHRLIEVLKHVVENPLAAAYESEAAKAEIPERQRYCLDVAREILFLNARDTFYRRNAASRYATLEPSVKGRRVPQAGPIDGGFTMGDTVAYWSYAKQIEEFVESYADGRLDEAAKVAARLESASQ